MRKSRGKYARFSNFICEIAHRAALTVSLPLLPSESYVADEIIMSRAKRRVRIGNTDAEGRMVMCDLLCEAKEKVSRGGLV